jgi:hypothetical protein
VKRFVCVPSSMGGVPDEATQLSKESQLSIRIEDDIETICIKSFPEDDFTDCMDEVKAGFIHMLDITNEFVNFTKDIHMLVTDINSCSYKIKPIVLTKHSLRFRSRFDTLGLHEFCIVDNTNEAYYQGEFTVI